MNNEKKLFILEQMFIMFIDHLEIMNKTGFGGGSYTKIIDKLKCVAKEYDIKIKNE